MTDRISVLGILWAAGAIFLAGCEQNAPAVAKPPAPEVTVSQPVLREVTDYFEFPGRTAAVGEVEVRARVTGYLVKVNFEDGQDVKKGDLLYEIDPRPYQAALDRATGELARLKALLDKAKADVTRSERLRSLAAISQDEYEQHVAQLAVYTASIQTAEAAVRDAELNLEFTTILAHIDGRVSRTRITEGNLIQPGTDDAAVLTTVVTTDPVYVYFNIDESALLKYEGLAWGSGQDLRPKRIKQLQIPVEIGLAHEVGFPHAGVLDFVDSKVDAKTGTIRARGVFDNAKQYLTPGLYVRVRLPFGGRHPALLVSERAIGTDQKQKYLLTVTRENVVERRPIKVGSLQNGLRVVEGGIGSDDWIVVKGLQRARPGATVRPHPAEKDVAASPPDSAPDSPPASSAAVTRRSDSADRDQAKAD
ncbi:MAG: efflux RND transporter periplasmic adaptor subunit [Planctomycetota bacterium]|nr:efflux RND transporter periplasmic adaptor subunit [Planctomycetota bacterium]